MKMETFYVAWFFQEPSCQQFFLEFPRHLPRIKFPWTSKMFQKSYMGTVNQRLLENYLDMFVSKESLRCEAPKENGYLLPQCISCRISDYYSDFYTNLPVASISLLALNSAWWRGGEVCVQKKQPLTMHIPIARPRPGMWNGNHQQKVIKNDTSLTKRKSPSATFCWSLDDELLLVDAHGF